MTKNNLSITAKCHAHLQTLKRPLVKLQKDPDEIVGRFISEDWRQFMMDSQMDGQTGKNNMSLDPDRGKT